MLSLDEIKAQIPNAIQSIDVPGLGQKYAGKVRDVYTVNNQRILITTDRISAFDRILGYIPYRGQILNQLSLWWFQQTTDIVRNHVVRSPDVNVTVAYEADALPVEVIVRGYVTGVTSTSMWTLYENGDRTPYGIALPEGLKKNDPLPQPAITPTTKAQDGGHDERLTEIDLLKQGLVAEPLWQQVREAALRLFERGQSFADQAGLILVDTKYEFGVLDGELLLIDEIHTPDSSRYWLKDSYGTGGSPEHYDKEFLRLWFAAQGYYGEGAIPIMPDEFIAQVARRYMQTYEWLTGATFVPGTVPAQKRIEGNLTPYISDNPGV